MKKILPLSGILIIILLAFYPIFQGKIPINGRNLVSFYSPWYFEKFPDFPTGVPAKPDMLDQVRQFYPYMAFTQRTLLRGEIPLWNPHNFAGNPHAAEWQSSIYYPLQIMLAVLPLHIWWTAYQMISFFLAGIFTYVYLRNLNLRVISSFFGAATFMLSGFMSVWNMGVFVSPQTIVWLPLILLSIDKLLVKKPETIISEQKEKNKKATWWMIGLFSLVFSILAGFWQTTFYVMVVSAIYAVYRSLGLDISMRRLNVSKSVLFILAWFPLSLLLASFYLFPSWELFQRSGRLIVNSTDNYQQYLLGYLLPFRHLVTLFIPDYFGHSTTRNYFAGINGGYYEQVIYVGIIPLTLALFSVLAKNNQKREIKFWLFLIVFSFIFAFNTPVARLIYQLKFPIVSTSIPNRILFVSALSLSILAAFGMEALGKVNRKYLKPAFRSIAIVLGMVFLQTAIWKNGFGAINSIGQPTLYIISLRNSVLPIVIFTLFWIILETMRFNLKKFEVMTFIFIGLSLGQSLYQHHKFTAFSEPMFIFPKHETINWLYKNAGLNRFTGYNGKFLENNFATYFGLYSIEGYDALNDFRRSQLIYSSATGRLSPDFMTSSDANLDLNLTNSNTLRLMRLFGVKYLVDHPEWLDVGPTAGLARLPVENEKLRFQDGDWKIWEYLDAYPRAFLAGNYEVIGDGQEMIDRLYSDDFNPRETLLLSDPPPEGFEIKSDDSGSVSIEKYTPTKITFKTKSKTNQLLFLSDTYYPGWWYRVDEGGKRPVLMADFALRAAAVPAGEHTVTMWYFPDSFRNGLIAAALAVAATAVIVTSRRFWPNISQLR